MEVNLTPDLEAKLVESAALQGREPGDLLQDALARYFGEEAVCVRTGPPAEGKPFLPWGGSLHEFFMNSPLRGADLDLERVKDYPRALDLE